MKTLGSEFNLVFNHLLQGYMIKNDNKSLQKIGDTIYEFQDDYITPWIPTQKDILSKEWRVTYERREIKK